MIYNASYIFGLKDPSVTDCNMAYWFRVSLCHTNNFGTSIIIVFVSFQADFLINFWHLYIIMLIFITFIILIIIWMQLLYFLIFLAFIIVLLNWFLILCPHSKFYVLWFYNHAIKSISYSHTNNGLIFMSNVSLSSFYFIMTTIRATSSFVPFILPLADKSHMNVFKNLLSLRVNFWIRIMYVEQEMYYVDGNILETILLQKTMNEDGHFRFWILDHLVL